jgi:hypothetical protein
MKWTMAHLWGLLLGIVLYELYYRSAQKKGG